MNSQHPPIITSRNNKNLTNVERQAIYEALLQASVNGGLKKGSFTNVACLHSVCQRTVRQIWHEAKLQQSQGLNVDVSSKIGKVPHRKRIQIDSDAVSCIPLRQRSNIRSLAKALGVGKSSVHKRIKLGEVRPHTNVIKPVLTEANKRARLAFCLSMVTRSGSSPLPLFTDMFNKVHIDEKWFYMSRPTKRYYLVPGEAEPVRQCKSKRFITKVMFLAATARPKIDQDSGREVFSGKIGIFPFTTLEPAQRSSKNRPAGTLETKAILSVTKEVYRSWLIQKVLPAIRDKWPDDDAGPIFIQQDNVKPHIDVDDREFVQAVAEGGKDIRLCFQPPNGPDLNVLDLGFFRAIQSLQEQQVLSNIDELVAAVVTSFESMPFKELNKVFLTLQSCMNEIMKVGGGNNYRTPHMGKDRLALQGNLPMQLHCDPSLIDAVCQQLNEG